MTNEIDRQPYVARRANSHRVNSVVCNPTRADSAKIHPRRPGEKPEQRHTARNRNDQNGEENPEQHCATF